MGHINKRAYIIIESGRGQWCQLKGILNLDLDLDLNLDFKRTCEKSQIKIKIKIKRKIA